MPSVGSAATAGPVACGAALEAGADPLVDGEGVGELAKTPELRSTTSTAGGPLVTPLGAADATGAGGAAATGAAGVGAGGGGASGVGGSGSGRLIGGGATGIGFSMSLGSRSGRRSTCTGRGGGGCGTGSGSTSSANRTGVRTAIPGARAMAVTTPTCASTDATTGPNRAR